MKISTRIEHIDSLRAIAALFVFLQHNSETFSNITQNGMWLLDVANKADFGRIGVVIFFIISGFVIPSSLRGDVPTGIKTFLVRRFFRLYPAFWLSIPLAILAEWVIGRQIPVYDIVAGITMIPSVFRAELILPPYWTLELELIFYILCIIFFRYGRLHSQNWLVFAMNILLFAFIVMLVFKDRIITTCLHLSLMFWGALCRKVYAGNHSRVALINLVIFASIIVFFPPFWAWYKSLDIGWATRYLRLAYAYPLSMLIFVVFAFIIPLRSKFIAWLGTISYSTYLFHPIISALMYKMILSNDVFQQYHSIIYILISYSITIMLSHAIFKYVELPAINYAHKVVSRQEGRSLAG